MHGCLTSHQPLFSVKLVTITTSSFLSGTSNSSEASKSYITIPKQGAVTPDGISDEGMGSEALFGLLFKTGISSESEGYLFAVRSDFECE